MLHCCKLLIAVVLVAQCAGQSDLYSDIKETCRALDDVLSWAKAHYYLLIVDFLFSIRVAQGELELLADHPGPWTPDIVTQIRLLREKVDKLADLAFSDIENDSENEYYKKFYRLVETKYYITSYYNREIRLNTMPQFEASAPNAELTFSEEQSDNCMREILGSKDIPKCTISRACFKQMTNEESEDYQLTHQLLYIILAQVRGCDVQLSRVAWLHDSSVDTLIDKFTSKIYQRLPSVLESGRYDLFSEMVMIGELFNYEEFYDPKFRELILLWQDSTGCYNEDSLVVSQLGNETASIGRRLFSDEIVDDTCSEHSTALALILLSLTLRHQLYSLPRPQQHWSLLHLLFLTLGCVGLVLFLLWCKKRRLRILRHFLV